MYQQTYDYKTYLNMYCLNPSIAKDYISIVMQVMDVGGVVTFENMDNPEKGCLIIKFNDNSRFSVVMLLNKLEALVSSYKESENGNS